MSNFVVGVTFGVLVAILLQRKHEQQKQELLAVVDAQIGAQDLRRYFLFSGAICTPHGGMADFEGSFDTLQQARDAYVIEEGTWGHVYDTKESRTVCESRNGHCWLEFDFARSYAAW